MVGETAHTQDKQITVDVPEARVAEFYAFYARFLEGRGGRRGHRHGRHGHRCHGRHRDAGPHEETTAERQGEVQEA